MNENEKVCKDCKRVLLISEFYMTTKGHPNSYCKRCQIERNRKRKQEIAATKTCPRCSSQWPARKVTCISCGYRLPKPIFNTADITDVSVKNRSHKICPSCKTEKPAADFRRTRSGYFGSYCRECEAKRSREDRIKAKEIGRCDKCSQDARQGKRLCASCQDQATKTSKEIRHNNKVRIVKLFGGKCFDCGFTSDVLAVYDLHHLDPEKKKTDFASMTNWKNWNKIQTNIEDCVLLCANCHRIRHWGEE